MTAPLLCFGFNVELTLTTPFLQSGLAQASAEFDASPLLDQKDRLIVSGDQIEGYLLAVMTSAKVKPAHLARWFGTKGKQIDAITAAKGEVLEAGRARVKINDLVGPAAPAAYQRYHRIEVEDSSGSVKSGSWQVIAQPSAPAQAFAFKGKGRLFAADSTEADCFIKWADAVFAMVPALGAIKSAGFGRLTAAKFNLAGSGDPLAQASASRGKRRGARITLTFDQPLLVDPDQRSGNVFEGSEVIPGSVIKGAIADMLEMAGKLDDYAALLSALVIRHAFPIRANAQRPSVAPLSIAFCGGVAVDWLTAPDRTARPQFRTDWKDKHHEAVGKHFYLPGNLHPYVRTRTAINAANAPVEAQLFSQRCVAAVGWEWDSAFVLPADATDPLQNQLATLLDFLARYGIAAIGKTAIAAKIAYADFCAAGPAAAGPLRLTLQTPAWMLTAEDLLRGKRLDLKALYQDYFSRIAPGCTLDDDDFIATQRWYGGARAVGKRSQLSDRYYPWLLTEPGSVFILHGIDATTAAEWARIGLPIVDSRRTWKCCPFVRENGFGEVRMGPAALHLPGDMRVS